MINICTIVGKEFLAESLALHDSLKKHLTDNFTITYLTTDKESYNILVKSVIDIIPIPLENIEEENSELQMVKSNRTKNEYKEALKSFLCHYLLTKKSLEHIFYIDNSVFFLSDPSTLFKKLKTKNCGISGPKNTISIIYFNGNEDGIKKAHWWRDKVLYKKGHPFLASDSQEVVKEIMAQFGQNNMCEIDGALIFDQFSMLEQSAAESHDTYNKTMKDIRHQISTPYIKKELKIAVGMAVFEDDYLLKQSIESIYPYTSQILISEGPTRYWQNQKRTTSTDDTNQILDYFPDPKNKIKILHGQYKGENEKHNTYMNFINDDADYLWNLYPDEVFKPEDIEKVIQLLQDCKYTTISIKPYSFFGGFDRYISSKQSLEPRVFKVYKGSKWLTHRPPSMKHAQQNILRPLHLNGETLANVYGVRVYHYSHVFPDQIANKTSDMDLVDKYKWNNDYFNDVYLPWVKGGSAEKEFIEVSFDGVHEWKSEYRKDTFTKAFKGTHPNILIRDRDEFAEKFSNQLKKYKE